MFFFGYHYGAVGAVDCGRVRGGSGDPGLIRLVLLPGRGLGTDAPDDPVPTAGHRRRRHVRHHTGAGQSGLRGQEALDPAAHRPGAASRRRLHHRHVSHRHRRLRHRGHNRQFLPHLLRFLLTLYLPCFSNIHLQFF